MTFIIFVKIYFGYRKPRSLGIFRGKLGIASDFTKFTN